MTMKKLINIVGVLMGVVMLACGAAILLGTSAIFWTTGIDNASFMADFYTWIYQAVIACVTQLNNLAMGLGSMAQVMIPGFGFILLGMGGFTICFFADRLSRQDEMDALLEEVRLLRQVTEKLLEERQPRPEALPDEPSAPEKAQAEDAAPVPEAAQPAAPEKAQAEADTPDETAETEGDSTDGPCESAPSAV